jgi:putative membrane protein
MKSLLLTAALAGLLFSECAIAQDDPAPRLTLADRAFLQKAAQASLAEIEAAQLARQKATRADIREFGQKMERIHGQALEELQSLAKAKGVLLPQVPDETHRELAKRLSGASGEEFDRIYVENAGVADHKAARQLFESGTRSADGEVSAFAAKVLSHIEHHLAMARQLDKTL